jgi:effector-binding domain-containing protein
MAIEEPKYTVALQEGPFEIRDYQATVVAEVTVTGDQSEAGGKGFRLLAGYIFGGNTKRESLAMTAPVAQQRASEKDERTSEKIAMTAPVTMIQSEGTWVVRFTMPAGYSLETLPVPIDPRVKLRAVAPARYVVIRFSGLASASNVEARTAELIAFAKERHLRTTGPAALAQYNPPWTLWFMRRNEVMIRLAN